MDNCENYFKNNVYPKAQHIENYKTKNDCSNFVHRECYELLHGLSSEQIKELMRFADSLRANLDQTSV